MSSVIPIRSPAARSSGVIAGGSAHSAANMRLSAPTGRSRWRSGTATRCLQTGPSTSAGIRSSWPQRSLRTHWLSALRDSAQVVHQRLEHARGSARADGDDRIERGPVLADDLDRRPRRRRPGARWPPASAASTDASSASRRPSATTPLRALLLARRGAARRVGGRGGVVARADRRTAGLTGLPPFGACIRPCRQNCPPPGPVLPYESIMEPAPPRCNRGPPNA